MLDQVIEALKSLDKFFLGPFLISLVSNSIPFVSLPYLLVIIGFTFRYVTLYERILLVISSALGATLGKIIIYFVGKGFSRFLSESSRENVELFNKIAKKSLTLAIFVFAALPLPDDVLYLPLGVTGFSLIIYFISVFLGKLFLKTLVVFYGSLLASLTEGVGYYVAPIFILISLILTYYIIKINWSKVIKAHVEEGLKASIKAIITELDTITRKTIKTLKNLLT